MVRRCKNDIRAVNFFYDGRWYWCLISDIRMRDAVDTPAALTHEPEGPVITDPAALTGMMVNAARTAQKAGKSPADIERILRKWNAGRNTGESPEAMEARIQKILRDHPPLIPAVILVPLEELRAQLPSIPEPDLPPMRGTYRKAGMQDCVDEISAEMERRRKLRPPLTAEQIAERTALREKDDAIHAARQAEIAANEAAAKEAKKSAAAGTAPEGEK